MKIEVAERVFNYNGVNLADPGAGLPPEQVRDFYTAMYPEITTATVEGPEERAGKLHYTFRRAVGTKA